MRKRDGEQRAALRARAEKAIGMLERGEEVW
jgi:hypothetical protein